ncbi:MAG: glycosyltransferase, partial [Lachnospiraceae bacterium]|nr:glycosyltransferase [Lachnospiraceae bacterium]
ENRGLAFSLNECIKLAKGKYIARMDADDECLPERFARQV